LRDGGLGEVNPVGPGRCILDHVELLRDLRRPVECGRIGDPDEIAAAVLWLCSNAASFAVGTILAIDGGYMA